jgi:hypothetical protein
VETLDNAEEVAKDSKLSVLEGYDALRVLYGDILRGYSFYKPETLYVKHFDDLDNIQIARKKEGLIKLFLDEGVPTEKERLDIIYETGEWTEQDEENISQLEYNISDNTKQLNFMSVPSQRTKVIQLIEEWQIKLHQQRMMKMGLLGVTAEHRAAKITNNYFVYYAFYRDPECLEPFWSEQDFQEMDEKDLIRYIRVYNQALQGFTDRTFRKIASLPFVLNFASYCKDQGMFFYGKPITKFTNYQLSVYTKAMRNTFVLRETKGTPPDINADLSIQALLNWYDEQYSIITTNKGGGGDGVVQEKQGKQGVIRGVKY